MYRDGQYRKGEKRVKFWWIVNVFWLVIFSILAIIIGIREVDGAGMVQTPEIRMLAFLVLGAAFICILIIQLIWFFLIRKRIRQS